MSADPESFMAGRRDVRAESEAHRWLRSIPDEERLQFVRRCLEIGSRDNRAYDLAVSCIARSEDAFSIFVQTLASPDASGIRFWLKFAVQKCGAVRTIREIASRLDSAPDTVSMALYWLPSIVPREEERAVSELAKLRSDASARGIIKGPKTTIASDGTVLFRNIYGS